MSFARDLATFLAPLGYDDLPPRATDYAAMLIASTLASAACGKEIVSTRIVRELARERGGTAQASLWFDAGPRLPAAEAAQVNAIMSDAAASDDSDLRAIVHCGTPLTATALALAERTGASGKEVLAAMVCGYEAAGRIGGPVSPDFRERGHHGSTMAIFAAAVAAGKLLKLDADQLTQTIALAATSASGVVKAADTSVAREYHASLVTRAGIDAALAAQKGFIAEETVLEGPTGFLKVYGGKEIAGIAAGIGESWDILTHMAVKLVPGGHPYHAFGEAAAKAARDGDIAADEIDSITVSRPGLTRLGGPKHPKDLIDMAHSPHYFTAAGAADQHFGWVHCSPDKIADPVIHRLIDKVRVGPPPAEHADRYRQGATVTIRTTAGREVTGTVFLPHGSAALGIDWADIEAKYRTLMPNSGLSTDRIEQSLAAIRTLANTSSVEPLIALLSR
ncbi:MAG: MmgE/PrpD family protein [Alphaproteobacteria bacterium]|nr:MmgE/PrpD family protein [Alphaproteobacteria bacterium]